MSSLKPALVRALNRFGLELRDNSRHISQLQQEPPQASAGWIVEVIGTQGVGKSTLNNALHRLLKSRWYFRGDLKYTGPTEVQKDDIEALHREVYLRKFDRVRGMDQAPWKTLTQCRQMSVVIYESLMITSNSFPRGFILDESLFKNFPREVLACDPDYARPLWERRAFVHLRSRDPTFTLERFVGRRDDRAQKGLVQHAEADADILRRIEEDNDLYGRMCETAKTLGTPAVTVYAEDSLERNIQQILDFETTLTA